MRDSACAEAAGRIFQPLGIEDIAFSMTPSMRSRLAVIHQREADGSLTPQNRRTLVTSPEGVADVRGERQLNRDSPDDSRTGVNIGAFPAFLQDRRKVRTAIDASRNRNGGRGADLLIFAGIRTHSSRRLLLSA